MVAFSRRTCEKGEFEAHLQTVIPTVRRGIEEGFFPDLNMSLAKGVEMTTTEKRARCFRTNAR
jgi:hypothetical protein